MWAPVGDYTLTRKRWYWLSVAMISVGLIALTIVPLSLRTMPLVSLLVLLTSVAATFLAFATEGLMVHNTPAHLRGRAAGWFQSGNQFGQTAGGGIGLWLMTHTPTPWMAGAGAVGNHRGVRARDHRLEEPPRALAGATVRDRAADALRSLGERRAIARRPTRTHSGNSAHRHRRRARSSSARIGPEWHAPADTVSLVLGLGGGIAIVAGCFAGGRLADRMDKPAAYAIACGLGLVACVGMALSPRTAAGYAASTLFYTFTLGMVAASFTGLVLAIIGHTAAATKINLFFALNTLFSLGMLRVAGWAHDAWASTGMLYTEAALGVAALAVFGLVAGRVRGVVTQAAI